MIESIREVVKGFCSHALQHEGHMVDAANGKKIEHWYTDSELSAFGIGGMKRRIYCYMREHQYEFLSEENKILEAFGAVMINWKSGGQSEAVIYQTDSGVRMLVCANWISGPSPLKRHAFEIKSIDKLVK